MEINTGTPGPIRKNAPKLSVSVCIMTKNDENLIEDCIKSINGFAREIIVIDLGSTDQTVNIVRKYTNRIFRVKWNNDYSEVRNMYFKYVSSDWVLYLDAWERLTPDSQKLITSPGFLDKKNAAYMVKVIEMLQDKEIEGYSCRLFKRNNNLKFKWVLHESVNDDIQKLAKKEKLKIVRSELEINKYLYLKYFDESEIHKEHIELAKHGLEDKKLENTVKLYYQIHLALSMNALGENEEEAEEILTNVLEEIRTLDKKAVFNIPLFMQPYLYFCFKLSKQEKYKEALKIIKEGVEIYGNSLNLLIRYCELLYANQQYKKCLDHIAKIEMLKREETYYSLEPIDFTMISRLSAKLEDLAFEKYEKYEAKASS